MKSNEVTCTGRSFRNINCRASYATLLHPPAVNIEDEDVAHTLHQQRAASTADIVFLTWTMVNIAHVDSNKAPLLTMQDDLGIVYLIDSAQQFWAELEDVLQLPQDEAPTLSLLDATLRRFMGLCSTYHEQYLQSPLQLEHACTLLLDSELFQFHSERMCEIIVDDAQTTTDPHTVYIFYEVLFYHGHRRADVFRSHKRWQPLLPLLMDHVLVEMDPDVEDTYVGTAVGRSTSLSSVPIPIEAKLRSLCVKLLYEVCKVQTLTGQDLKIFDDNFIDYLFDLVEQTKYMQDETFNYSVIKLIIALNEQFMVVGLGDEDPNGQVKKGGPEHKNRVLRVLMRRLGSSKTFGENMIFMLNRAQRTPEDFCMKLLILKILYVLFSTKGTSEYFYTNDLCVLVDVFLRELSDLDDDSESLRHTYLRVLHPLLTRTQLRNTPYKRPQILLTLESMTSNTKIREVTPTTKRLVDRCLTGEWCVQLMELRKSEPPRVGSPGSDVSSILSPPGNIGSLAMAASKHLEVSGGNSLMKSMKFSKSVEHLSLRPEHQKQPLRSPLDQVRRPSNASMTSLPSTSSKNVVAPANKKRSTSAAPETSHTALRHNSLPPDPEHHHHHHHHSHSPSPIPTPSDHSRPPSSTSSTSPPSSAKSEGFPSTAQPRRKPPPPPAPSKRRKPPAIPIGRTNGGAIITSIKSSEPSPLSKAHKPPIGLQQAS
ncbi:unnamed protein product [Cyclocybe aegerita]|uniref:SPIN90/Ldb17 leucine-rich domain-containing protein n=1 Tax=Cyclocybe aegerita TaxID=1973307 RepID=A0A8S0X6H4_CYCAE|nr:unnamed protein product [Cyclocybe aegerita]